FLLESGAAVGEMGSWHLLGADPIGSAWVRGRRWRLRLAGVIEVGEGDPWGAVEAWWEAWRAPPAPAAADLAPGLPFTGGAVGYIGYEMGEHLERLGRRGTAPHGMDAMPDLHLHLYDEVVAIERSSGRAFAVARGRSGRAGCRWWEREPRRCEEHVPRPIREISVSLDDGRYRRHVEEIRAMIARGDVYEVNLCRTHTLEGGPSPWALHRRLRRLQPVPYAALIPWRPVAVVSASPERFLRRRGPHVETRPIKGTAARGSDDEEDRHAARALLESEKERAELAMIIDVERNDLGRVALPGSVRVVEEAALEAYATVLHTVATVAAEIPEDLSPFAILRATFPGGSITGAPKIAAMKTILALEPTPRKAYTGSIGWISPQGDLDLSIAIRTALFHEDRIHFSVGGAITWDSDPRRELAELEAKGRAIVAALRGSGGAEGGKDSGSAHSRLP
ncbi:MAG: anthranilate synthase component I family protein, partial [Planctomycetota bacterium]